MTPLRAQERRQSLRIIDIALLATARQGICAHAMAASRACAMQPYERVELFVTDIGGHIGMVKFIARPRLAIVAGFSKLG